MEYSWVVWIVVITIILVIIYFYTNYHLIAKTEEEKKQELKRNDSDIIPLEETISSDSYYSTDSSISGKSLICYDDDLPPHIYNPDYKPAFYYRGGHKSKGEIECAAALERIYGLPFYTVRPDWLKNKANMELDCYAEIPVDGEVYRIAVEYQGRQHYDIVPKFHPNGKADLDAQQARDALKRRLCRENGVYLIEVKYDIPVDQIESYLRWMHPAAVKTRQQLISS